MLTCLDLVRVPRAEDDLFSDSLTACLEQETGVQLGGELLQEFISNIWGLIEEKIFLGAYWQTAGEMLYQLREDLIWEK